MPEHRISHPTTPSEPPNPVLVSGQASSSASGLADMWVSEPESESTPILHASKRYKSSHHVRQYNHSPSVPPPHSSQLHPKLPRKKSIPVTDNGYTWADDPGAMSGIARLDHTAQRIATAAAWKLLLPKLVYPFMQWQEARANKCEPLSVKGASEKCSDCLSGSLQAEVNVISFMSMFPIIPFAPNYDKLAFTAIQKVSILYCTHCTPPALSLLRLGVFSSTPIRPPKWGFDMNLLEHLSQLCAFGVPNLTAWCNATVAFLKNQGVEIVPSPVSDQPSLIYLLIDTQGIHNKQ